MDFGNSELFGRKNWDRNRGLQKKDFAEALSRANTEVIIKVEPEPKPETPPENIV